MPTGSSRSITRAPIAARTLRASAWAQTAPNRPVEAPTTAAGLLRSGRSASGRESQSSAFLSWPGIEWLYSGVATRTASASAIASNSACDRVGAGVLVVLVVRRDRLQPVELDELGLRRQQVAGRPEELGVVGAGAQAAGEAEDLHRITPAPARG